MIKTCEPNPIKVRLDDIPDEVLDKREPGRDEIVRRCSDGEGWAEVFAALVPPPKGRSYTVLGPEEFGMVLDGTLRGGGAMMVDGDITIVDKNINTLSNIVIRGSVTIARCPHLEAVRLACSGRLEIADCPQLRSLQGEIFGPASISNCGIQQIGADFRAASSLFLQDCKALSRLNCEVVGRVEVRGGGGVKTGPAFQPGGYLLTKRGGCEQKGLGRRGRMGRKREGAEGVDQAGR